ncbi:MAG: CocE/NonD family hydrolase C-terminal non-catalytic domain-containing protein, partial [Candidatus Methylomirabilales bacterium]
HAAIDQDDTNWIVIARDVAPDGRERELSKGFLKASHRALDEGRSMPWEPYHLHTHKDPVKPGEVYAYAIALAPIANVFRTGHQLKLVITCMDHAKLRTAAGSVGDSHAPWHLCSSRTTMHQIFHDPNHPSHLVVPVIPQLVVSSS